MTNETKNSLWPLTAAAIVIAIASATIAGLRVAAYVDVDCGSVPLPMKSRGHYREVYKSITLKSGAEALPKGEAHYVVSVNGCTVVLTKLSGPITVDWGEVASVAVTR
tara:strand:+ start:6434 stop:6757 length:324 start_codon:yes stop_codon:yes gene_type:complete